MNKTGYGNRYENKWSAEKGLNKTIELSIGPIYFGMNRNYLIDLELAFSFDQE